MSARPMSAVKLRNGSEEHEGLVRMFASLILPTMLETEAGVFVDAVLLARDPRYVPFGANALRLDRAAITQGGKMHDSIRNIILSAVTGDSLGEWTLVDPRAP